MLFIFLMAFLFAQCSHENSRKPKNNKWTKNSKTETIQIKKPFLLWATGKRKIQMYLQVNFAFCLLCNFALGQCCLVRSLCFPFPLSLSSCFFCATIFSIWNLALVSTRLSLSLSVSLFYFLWPHFACLNLISICFFIVLLSLTAALASNTHVRTTAPIFN